MSKLLYMCTKNAHFTISNKIYLQLDGVAMGSSLGPVSANIYGGAQTKYNTYII